MASLFLAIAAFQFAGVAKAEPQASVRPDAAPQAWLSYAELATTSVMAWLAEGDAGATEIVEWLDENRPEPDSPGSTIVVRLWIDQEGRIERVAADPLGDVAMDAQLVEFLVGRSLDGPPPSDMILPLRIGLDRASKEPTRGAVENPTG